MNIHITPYSNDKAREVARVWYYAHREAVLAKRKAAPKTVQNAKVAARQRFWKAQLFELLGDKCKRCGFTDVRALQIDHIDGKGTQQRKAFPTRSTTSYYRLFVLSEELRSTVQLLCANCNWIKRHENDELNWR